MLTEPVNKRTAVFIDGQNLFHSAREAFGYTYPNYDVKALAEAVCRSKGWKLVQTRFYTGIPDRGIDGPLQACPSSGKGGTLYGLQRNIHDKGHSS